MSINSVAALIDEAEKKKKPLWKVVIDNDAKERAVLPEDSFDKMRHLWMTMKRTSADYNGSIFSASGLSGTDGEKMHAAVENDGIIGGRFFGRVIEEALKTGESNACMKRIVAAPTAGSCGVLPAVLIPLSQEMMIEDDEIVRALFVGAGFGAVIAERATIAGAEGGCQAEIGAASAMAAAMIVYLKNGTPEMCGNACAMALKNLLGLVCDPVAGLVEVPCVKRNVIGAVNAVSSANMALAGIKSRIPPDEVIDAMRSIGNLMSPALKETSKGGLAQTPTGLAIGEDLENGRNIKSSPSTGASLNAK